MNVGTPIAGNEGTAQVLISSMATEPRLSCNRLSVMSSTEYTCTQWFLIQPHGSLGGPVHRHAHRGYQQLSDRVLLLRRVYAAIVMTGGFRSQIYI